MANGLEPILILTIEADHPLRADHVAIIIDRLASQFESHQRRRSVGENAAILRLQDLRTGSLIAKLIAVADAANTIAENSDVIVAVRDSLAGFYSQLFDALQLLTGRSGRRAAAHDRRTIEILASPVARDNAQQVCLQLYGDNNRVIIITPGTVERIVGDNDQELAIPIAPLAEETAEDHATTESIEKRMASLIAVDKDSPGGLDHIYSHREGTLVCVDGEWYVRYRGGDGILVPLRDSKFDKSALDETRRYLVEGRILRGEDQVTGFAADTIIKPTAGGA